MHVTAVNKREFDGSGLTGRPQRGATYVGADRVGERIAATVVGIADRPSLTYVYDSDLDWTGHRYGVDSAQWLQQLAMVDAEAEQLREALPERDPAAGRRRPRHGRRPRDARVDVDEVDGCATASRCSAARPGSATSTAAAGAVDDVVATWREVLGERATVLDPRGRDRARLVRAVAPGVLPRLGDVMVACHGDTAVMSTARLRLRGHPRRPARLADLGRDAHPDPGRLTAAGLSARRRRASWRPGRPPP